MTDKAHILSYYLGAVGLLMQIVVITLQLRTYKRTGHSSLLLLAVSTACGILYLVFAYAPQFVAIDVNVRWSLHLVVAGLLTIQSLVGIWGVKSLLSAFEETSAQVRIKRV